MVAVAEKTALMGFTMSLMNPYEALDQGLLTAVVEQDIWGNGF